MKTESETIWRIVSCRLLFLHTFFLLLPTWSHSLCVPPHLRNAPQLHSKSLQLCKSTVRLENSLVTSQCRKSGVFGKFFSVHWHLQVVLVLHVLLFGKHRSTFEVNFMTERCSRRFRTNSNWLATKNGQLNITFSNDVYIGYVAPGNFSLWLLGWHATQFYEPCSNFDCVRWATEMLI